MPNSNVFTFRKIADFTKIKLCITQNKEPFKILNTNLKRVLTLVKETRRSRGWNRPTLKFQITDVRSTFEL
jgi:hypothetical protein